MRPQGTHYLDIEAFRAMMQRVKAERGLIWHDIADQTGLSLHTVVSVSTNIHPGQTMHVDTLVTLLAWLGRPTDLSGLVQEYREDWQVEQADSLFVELVAKVNPDVLATLARHLNVHLESAVNTDGADTEEGSEA